MEINIHHHKEKIIIIYSDTEENVHPKCINYQNWMKSSDQKDYASLYTEYFCTED